MYIQNHKQTYGGFLKWWVSPTTMSFPTKNDQFGVWNGGTTILGNTHIEKHPWVSFHRSQSIFYYSPWLKFHVEPNMFHGNSKGVFWKLLWQFKSLVQFGVSKKHQNINRCLLFWFRSTMRIFWKSEVMIHDQHDCHGRAGAIYIYLLDGCYQK